MLSEPERTLLAHAHAVPFPGAVDHEKASVVVRVARRVRWLRGRRPSASSTSVVRGGGHARDLRVLGAEMHCLLGRRRRRHERCTGDDCSSGDGTPTEHAGASASAAGADAEHAVSRACRQALLIDGEWRAGESGGQLAVEDPATERDARGGRRRTPERRDGRARVSRPAQACWAAQPPRERGEILRRTYEALSRARRRAGAADDARDGQGAARVEGRDRLLRGVFPLVLGGGGADPRPLHGEHHRQRPHPHHAPAGGPVRARDAMELPHGDGGAQDSAGDRRRVHDGGQAGPADPALDARPGGHPRSRPGCRRACSTWSPASQAGAPSNRSCATPARARCPSPDRRRSAEGSWNSARAAATGLDGARRQRALPGLRGRRSRGGRRGRDGGEDAQCGRGVHGGQPLPRRRGDRRGVRARLAERMSALRSAAARSRSGRGPADRRDPARRRCWRCSTKPARAAPAC